MQTIVFAGKGGVGKSTCAAALGMHFYLEGHDVALIDYDGGHSIERLLGIKTPVPSNTVTRFETSPHLAVVENTEYVGIIDSKKKGWPTEKYLDQFKGDLGILPFADMVNAFFGAPTDVPTLEKFTHLVMVLRSLDQRGFKYAILDVEPTAGLERLLVNAESTARSLQNLSRQGKMVLMAVGATWPDIAAYLKSEYMRNADTYTAHIEEAVRLIRAAKYFIVCTPEIGPVRQTALVRSVIEKSGGTVSGYVVNNMTGAPYEEGNISRLPGRSRLVKINRSLAFHEGETDTRTVLRVMGAKVAMMMK